MRFKNNTDKILHFEVSEKSEKKGIDFFLPPKKELNFSQWKFCALQEIVEEGKKDETD